MILPVRKTAWKSHTDKPYLSREITAGGYTGTLYKHYWTAGRSHGVGYWVCFAGTTSQEYPRQYMADNWFRERVEALRMDVRS